MAAAPQTGESRQMLGIIGPTAILQPFAEYRAGVWTDDGAKAWDEPALPPPAWFAKRGAPPTKWRALAGGDEQRTVTTSKTVAEDQGCFKMWALQSDAAGQPWLTADDSKRYNRLKLAVSGDLVASPFVEVPEQAGDARDGLLTAITPMFDKLEDAEVVRLLSHLPSAATRHASRPKIEAAFQSRIRVGGRTLYHLRITRAYPKPAGSPDAQCEDLSVLSAWIGEEPATAGTRGRMTVLSATLMISDCDRAAVPVSVPLGIVTAGSRAFVATADFGYESLDYGVMEIDGGLLRRLLLTSGGGC